MFGSRSTVLCLVLAGLLPAASAVVASTDDTMDLSAPRNRRLAHYEMHGLLGADPALSDFLRIGRSLFTDEQYDGAEVIFNVALRHHPSSTAARFALGQALFARGDYSRGAVVIREALERDPQWAKIDYSVYMLYDRPGELDRQVRLLKDYLRDRAEDRDALFMLGFFQYHLTRNDQARAAFLRLSGMQPADEMVSYYARLLDEKEKMRLGLSPYASEARHPARRRPHKSGKRASGKSALRAKPDKRAADSPPPATDPTGEPIQAAPPVPAPAGDAAPDAPVPPPMPPEPGK